MPDEVIVSAVQDGVAQLRLDRPEQRNAMSGALVGQMIAGLAELEKSARAIILSGSGRGFCAGSDLAGLAAMSEAERARFEEASGRLSRMIACASIPVVAAVHGFAVGGGLTLAVACDIVVTTPEAKWSLPEVPIGLFPAWGLWAVEERIGRSAARRLSWGIDTLDGQAAQAAGLADIVAADVHEQARAIATRLAALPAAQAKAVKDYFQADRQWADADRRANGRFIEASRTSEAQASFAHFGSRLK